MAHYQEEGPEWNYEGFPSPELAREFARRWVRDSLEELREPDQTAKDLRSIWFMFGEDAVTDGFGGLDELDYFIEHPATEDERDWKAILKTRKTG